MFDKDLSRTTGFVMHGSPAATIEEVVWRHEREHPRSGQAEVERLCTEWRAGERGVRPASLRLAVARVLVGLARRIAPSVETGTVATAQ